MRQFERRGLTTRFLDQDNTLSYSKLAPGAARTLLVALRYGHDPLVSARIAPLLACLCVLDAYQAIADELPVTIKWLFDSSSARTFTNFSHSVAENRSLLQADGCLYYAGETASPGIELAIGTKGYLRVALAVQTAKHEMPSLYGTVAPNAAWRLLWALHSLKDAHEEILIDGFYDTLHSVDDDAHTSSHMLSTMTADLAQQLGTAQPLLGLQGQQLYYTHLLTPTCTITHINSGNTDAVIPAQAEAQVDFYLVPDQDPQDIFAKLQRHLFAQGFSDTQIRLLAANPPAHTPATHPFVQQVQHATSVAYGQPPHTLPLLPDSMSCNILHNTLDIPVVIAPLRPSATQISENERNALDVAAYSKQMALLLAAFANGEGAG